MNEWMPMLGMWYYLIETFIWMNDVCHSLRFLLNLIFNKNFWMDTLHLIYCCQVFEDKNVFWNFISKQVDLISGIMSLSRMYFNTVFRQFFFKIPSLFWFPTKFMWGWTLVVSVGDKIWTPMPPPSHQWGHHCPPIRPHCQLTRPDFSP